MKKLCLILAVLLVPALCFAGAYKLPSKAVVEKLSLSADASGVALDDAFQGNYLFQVEIYTSADDAVTFSIASETGTTLFTTTTTAATSGEIDGPDAYYMITGAATYTLSGLGSGTATILITAVP